MNHPYRTPATINKKKKPCLFFHNWEVYLKPESYNYILNSRTTLESYVYYVDIFNDYLLRCKDCGTQLEMMLNPHYIQLAFEDAKSKFAENVR